MEPLIKTESTTPDPDGPAPAVKTPPVRPTPPQGRPTRGRNQPGRVALIAVLAAFAALIVVRLGPALIGLKTFSGVDVLSTLTPWNDRWLVTTPGNPWVGDTIDNLLPGYAEMYRRLWAGELPLWSSLSGSGAALLSSPNIPTLTPSAIWLLLTPTSWAIGFAKLIQLAMAFAGMTLWLRRLGTSWAAGAVAGLIYCGSGFFVGWSGWVAQASVAATIPMLFWAVERFLALRTARAALVISAAVAWLLLGGFPAVAGHALYAGALYFLVRLLVESRRLGRRTAALTFAGGAGAVLLGVGLSAVQLLPFASSLAGTDFGYRSNQFDVEQPFRSMLSVFLPDIFNSREGFPHTYGPTTNPIEAYAFLGMGAVMLAVLAVLAGRWNGVARGAVPVLTVVGLLSAALVWQHGFWTDWLRDIPIFADNNSGRLRGMVALVGSALAGVGFNLILRDGLPRHVRIRLIAGAWLMVALAAIALGVIWVRYSPVVSDKVLLIDAALGGATVGIIAIAFTLSLGRPQDTVPVREGGTAVPRGRRGPLLAASLVAFAVLLGGQALYSTNFFWPSSDVDEFYPETPAIDAAVSASGDGRALLGDGVFLGSTGAVYDLRTVTGHSFQAPTWSDLLLALDPNAFTPPGRTPTNPRVSFKLDNGSLTNPLLDRMSVSTVLTSPAYGVPGPLLDLDGQPRTLEVTGGAPLDVGSSEVPGGKLTPQSLRGVVVQVAGSAGDGINGIGIDVVIRDADGTELAKGSVIRSRWEPQRVQIPIAGEDLDAHPGPLSIGVSVESRSDPAQTLALTAVDSQVETIVIGSQQDGLREAYADASMTVWQRPSALPRIRWAPGSVTIPDPAARVAALGDPSTPRSTVVLSEPGPEASGADAQLTTVSQTGDQVAVDVEAGGDGYLVLGDAVQTGWTVTIDGQPAELVDADHAFGAVLVPEGSHRVSFQYVNNAQRVGALVTIGCLAIVVLILVLPPLIRRRRGRDTAGAEG